MYKYILHLYYIINVITYKYVYMLHIIYTNIYICIYTHKYVYILYYIL